MPKYVQSGFPAEIHSDQNCTDFLAHTSQPNGFHSASFENPIFGTCRAGWNYDFQPWGWKSLFQPAPQLQPIRFSKKLLWKIVYITRNKTQRKHFVWLQSSFHSGRANFTLMQSLCFAPCNVIYYFIHYNNFFNQIYTFWDLFMPEIKFLHRIKYERESDVWKVWIIINL